MKNPERETKITKTKRNLIQIWLLCAAMLPAVAQAQFTYTNNNGAITITGYTGSGGAVTIPGTINGQPVTSIGTNAFSACTSLNSTTVPNSVTSIGSYAFSGCTNLISVFFGTNAPNADSTVFSDDNNALVYYLPGTTGWTSTFAGIQTVLLPYTYTANNGAIIITGYTGSGGAVTIPSTVGGLPVTSIGSYAFQNSGLTTVTIPNSVTNTGTYLFYGCTNLTSAMIGNGVTIIEFYAFQGCTTLTNVTIGNGVTIIYDYAFQDCGLTSVTIPNSVTYIGNFVFSDCYNLNEVIFQSNAPTSYNNNNSTVFSGDSNAFVYYLPGTTGWGQTFDGLPTALLNLPVPYNYTTNNGVITITGYTGSGGAVTIPSAIYVAGATNFLPVTTIGANAFSGCSGLISVIIPNSVTNIGSYAFSGCTNLLGVFVASNASAADSTLFAGDTNALAYLLYLQNPNQPGISKFGGLQIVLLPYTFTINNGAITITGYTGSGGALTIPGTIGGLPVTSIANEAFYYCASLTSVTIPSSVTNIGHGAFASCSNLASVTIPDSVINIGICAFWNCTGLTSVTLSTNITSLGASEFDSCTSLTSVIIPNGVLKIGGSAFHNCTSLTSVMIPASVNNIGIYAFDSETSLMAIMVDPQNFNYGSVDGVLLNKSQNTLIQFPGGKAGSYTVPNSLTNIGNSAFDCCGSLTSVAIPTNTIRIGDWAFDSCSGLTSVTIPNSVINLGCYAFESCSSLTSVTILGNFIGIPYHAFEDCTSLINVTFGSAVAFPFSGYVDFYYGFTGCSNVTSIYAMGNAPGTFLWNLTNATVISTLYYLPDPQGSGQLLYSTDLPLKLWLPQVQTGDTNFGVQTNQFGFNIKWASGQKVVVEACTNLTNPVWSPLGTYILTNGTAYFSDSQWMNYPYRFYRIGQSQQ